MDTIPRDLYELHHDSTIMPHARANQELAQPSRLRRFDKFHRGSCSRVTFAHRCNQGNSNYGPETPHLDSVERVTDERELVDEGEAEALTNKVHSQRIAVTFDW